MAVSSMKDSDYELLRAPRCERCDVGLVLPLWNRPQELSRLLTSLDASDLDGVAVLMVDDASDDADTRRLFESADETFGLARRRQRDGVNIHQSLRSGWDFLLEEYGCRYLSVLDADTYVKPDWLRRLCDLHERLETKYSQLLLTGFNTPGHAMLERRAGYGVKTTVGGANLFFDRSLYDRLVRPSLQAVFWDWYLMEACREQSITIVCTVPSVVQHTGRYGMWSSGALFYDWAPDFGLPRPLARLIEPVLYQMRRFYDYLRQLLR